MRTLSGVPGTTFVFCSQVERLSSNLSCAPCCYFLCLYSIALPPNLYLKSQNMRPLWNWRSEPPDACPVPSAVLTLPSQGDNLTNCFPRAQGSLGAEGSEPRLSVNSCSWSLLYATHWARSGVPKQMGMAPPQGAPGIPSSHSVKAFIRGKVMMVYAAGVIKKQFYILWKVQNDNKIERHKDMMTKYQFTKMFSKQWNERK